jgi:hypothetical protein
MQDSMDILYGLVLDLRQGVDDLQFRLQQLDGKASALLHILSTFQRAAAQAKHVPAETFGQGEQELPAEGGNLGQAMQVDGEAVAAMDNTDADVQMEWRGTPVKEEL